MFVSLVPPSQHVRNRLLTPRSPQPRRESAHSRRSGAQFHDFSSLLQQDGVAGASGNYWPNRQYLVAVQFLPASSRLGVFYESRSQALSVRILLHFSAVDTPFANCRHIARCSWLKLVCMKQFNCMYLGMYALEHFRYLRMDLCFQCYLF